MSRRGSLRRMRSSIRFCLKTLCIWAKAGTTSIVFSLAYPPVKAHRYPYQSSAVYAINLGIFIAFIPHSHSATSSATHNTCTLLHSPHSCRPTLHLFHFHFGMNSLCPVYKPMPFFPKGLVSFIDSYRCAFRAVIIPSLTETFEYLYFLTPLVLIRDVVPYMYS